VGRRDAEDETAHQSDNPRRRTATVHSGSTSQVLGELHVKRRPDSKNGRRLRESTWTFLAASSGPSSSRQALPRRADDRQHPRPAITVQEHEELLRVPAPVDVGDLGEQPPADHLQVLNPEVEDRRLAAAPRAAPSGQGLAVLVEPEGREHGESDGRT